MSVERDAVVHGKTASRNHVIQPDVVAIGNKALSAPDRYLWGERGPSPVLGEISGVTLVSEQSVLFCDALNIGSRTFWRELGCAFVSVPDRPIRMNAERCQWSLFSVSGPLCRDLQNRANPVHNQLIRLDACSVLDAQSKVLVADCVVVPMGDFFKLLVRHRRPEPESVGMGKLSAIRAVNHGSIMVARARRTGRQHCRPRNRRWEPGGAFKFPASAHLVSASPEGLLTGFANGLVRPRGRYDSQISHSLVSDGVQDRNELDCDAE